MKTILRDVKLNEIQKHFIYGWREILNRTMKEWTWKSDDIQKAISCVKDVLTTYPLDNRLYDFTSDDAPFDLSYFYSDGRGDDNGIHWKSISGDRDHVEAFIDLRSTDTSYDGCYLGAKLVLTKPENHDFVRSPLSVECNVDAETGNVICVEGQNECWNIPACQALYQDYCKH